MEIMSHFCVARRRPHRRPGGGAPPHVQFTQARPANLPIELNDSPVIHFPKAAEKEKGSKWKTGA
jgi:hypothetical protein